MVQYFPIVINSRKVVLDGHHRLKICRVGIEPKIVVKDFPSPDHEKLLFMNAI